MTLLRCTECGTEQDVTITRTTYEVECEACRSQFDVPRKHRVNKKTNKETSSRTNIRLGLSVKGHEELHVGWTVQSANKHNQFMEKKSVIVDVSNHPQKTYWYVALFKCLQDINEYKEARIWIRDETLRQHLAGELTIPDNDLRTTLKDRILALMDEKFLGVEVCESTHEGNDIRQMVNG